MWAESGNRPPLVPGFILLFLMAAWHLLGWLPGPLQTRLGQASQACLTAGVAALGMKTSFLELTRSGRRSALFTGFTTSWTGLFMLRGAGWPADGKPVKSDPSQLLRTYTEFLGFS